MTDFLDLLRVPVWGWLTALFLLVTIALGWIFLLELIAGLALIVRGWWRDRQRVTFRDPDPTVVVPFHGREKRIAERETRARMQAVMGMSTRRGR